jgi:hypothetical protein
VLANPYLGGDGQPDMLVFALHGAGWAAQQVEQDGRAPLRVTGTLPRAGQRKGRVVCFSGRTSGVNRCGRIFASYGGLRCARVRARHGDSGGPVYTRARDGEVRAAGIVTAMRNLGALTPPWWHDELCYTPIQDVLAAFGARLPTGAFSTLPGPVA